MERDKITQNFRRHTAVTESDMDLFFELAKMKSLEKNEMLIEQDQPGAALTLVVSGCLMTYYSDKDCDPHVMQFGREMWWTGDLQAFVENTPSLYSIKALTESKVAMLEKSNFDQLCREAPTFDHYFRILFQKSLVSHQKRIIRNISNTAEEKYEQFLKTHPEIELIVPQKYIASYLGITPEFLSKIRKKRVGK